MNAACLVTTLGASCKEIVLDQVAQQIQTDKSLISPTWQHTDISKQSEDLYLTILSQVSSSQVKEKATRL